MKNDYLWDKTGEADPEIERLENALQAFRYQESAAPVLPAKILPFKKEQPRRIFPFTFAAAAAACLLFGVISLGVWFQILKNNIEVSKDVAETHEPQQQRRQPAKMTSDGATDDLQKDESIVKAPAVKGDSVVQRAKRSKPFPARKPVKIRQTAPALPLPPLLPPSSAVRQKETLAQNFKATKQPPAAEVRLTEEEKYAYEQLMMALSFTSSKLKLVKDKVEGMEE